MVHKTSKWIGMFVCLCALKVEETENFLANIYSFSPKSAASVVSLAYNLLSRLLFPTDCIFAFISPRLSHLLPSPLHPYTYIYTHILGERVSVNFRNNKNGLEEGELCEENKKAHGRDCEGCR